MPVNAACAAACEPASSATLTAAREAGHQRPAAMRARGGGGAAGTTPSVPADGGGSKAAPNATPPSRQRGLALRTPRRPAARAQPGAATAWEALSRRVRAVCAHVPPCRVQRPDSAPEKRPEEHRLAGDEARGVRRGGTSASWKDSLPVESRCKPAAVTEETRRSRSASPKAKSRAALVRCSSPRRSAMTDSAASQHAAAARASACEATAQ